MALAVTWHGHATVLIEAGGTRLLTDPVLRDRVAHLTRRAPSVDVASLGPIDAVLISHAHRDHLDLPTLRALAPDVPVVAPPGTARVIGHARTVHELGPGEQIEIGAARIRATDAQHDVRRGFRDHGSVGYVIDEQVYFAGDTDRFAGMSELAGMELALVPVWGWGTSLGPGHMDPEAAAEALALLRPKAAVPIHWGTYFPAHAGRGGHPLLTDPPHEFAKRAARTAPDCRVRILAPGERLAL